MACFFCIVQGGDGGVLWSLGNCRRNCIAGREKVDMLLEMKTQVAMDLGDGRGEWRTFFSARGKF